MTRDELIAHLKEYKNSAECETGHILADEALLAFINDPQVSAAYRDIKKWYA